MRLENSESAQASVPSPVLTREAMERANRWLARFSPLLDGLEGLGDEECRQRLADLPRLRADGEAALQSLEPQATAGELGLLDTLRSAVRELDGLEGDYRRRLALLAPGDPAGEVRLDRVQAKLAEVAARRELEEATGSLVVRSLEVNVSRPSWGSAFFLGLFAFGWLSFTTLHAFLMIGGVARAFGAAALLLLGFYAIFFAAGAAMAWAAVRAGSREHLRLDGRNLTVSRRLLGYSWKRNWRLAPESRAYVAAAAGQNNQPQTEIAIWDERGREIRLAFGRPPIEQQALVDRINAYLAGLGRDA